MIGRLLGLQGDYEYLQESSLAFLTPKEVIDRLHEAGFSNFGYWRFLAGMLTVFWGTKRA